MSTPKKTVMLEISHACGEAMNSGGVYAFFNSLAALCDAPLRARLLTAINDAEGNMSLAKARTTKLDYPGSWWLRRLHVEDWETEVRQDALLKSYMDGVKQFRTASGRHILALTKLLESLCPMFEEFVLGVELPDDALTDLRPGADREMRIPCYRFPTLVQARICWEKVHGPTDWSDGMDLSDAQYDEDRAAVKAALEALVAKRDRAKWDEKTERERAVPFST